MDHDEPSRIEYTTAAEVWERAGLGDAARGLRHEGLTPRQYLDRLVQGHLHADAIRFLAYTLPKREAVWWACLCVDRILGPGPPPLAAALAVARAWVIEPSDDNRRAALPAAEAAEVGTPAGCAAAAAYFSGGSLARPELPAVAPGEHITAHLVASALMLAAVIRQPEKSVEKLASFLQLGREVASGQHLWPEADKEETERKGGSGHGDARRTRR
jgi:hypothetical protein